MWKRCGGCKALPARGGDDSVPPKLTPYEAERLDLERKQLQATKAAAKPDWWTRLGVLAGLVAIGVSGFIGERTLSEAANQADRSDQAARYSSVSELALEVDRLMVELPRQASCFEGPCPADLTADERRSARQLAYYLLDFYVYMQTQMFNLGYTPSDGRFVLRAQDTPREFEDWSTWSETAIGAFSRSDLLCVTLAQEREAYGSMFVNAVVATGACPRLQPLEELQSE